MIRTYKTITRYEKQLTIHIRNDIGTVLISVSAAI